MRTWHFLPEFLRSLRPYDRFLMSYICVCNCCSGLRVHPNQDDEMVAVVTRGNEEPVSRPAADEQRQKRAREHKKSERAAPTEGPHSDVSF